MIDGDADDKASESWAEMLLQGCVDGDHRRAGTGRTRTFRLNGESVAAAIPRPRCVYVRRPVKPLQASVRRPLCNLRAQYFAANVDREQAAAPGRDHDVAYRVETPA